MYIQFLRFIGLYAQYVIENVLQIFAKRDHVVQYVWGLLQDAQSAIRHS